MINCRTKISLCSPAKLNLGLRIVGRRADGHHLLESLFWPIDLCDQIDLSPEGGSFSIENHTNTPLVADKNNLAWRALEVASNEKWGMTLSKQIPVGGGLGGGSSNAGTILSHFWNDEITPERVKAASCLGADVPFFLYRRPAMVYGVGEVVRPIQWKEPPPNLFFLLLILPESTSTPAVFSDYMRHGKFGNSEEMTWNQPWNALTFEQYIERAQNDLEPSARRVTPLIGKALDSMRLLPASHIALSGSGSTCFGIFRDEATRQESDKALQKFCREHQCRTLRAETFA